MLAAGDRSFHLRQIDAQRGHPDDFRLRLDLSLVSVRVDDRDSTRRRTDEFGDECDGQGFALSRCESVDAPRDGSLPGMELSSRRRLGELHPFRKGLDHGGPRHRFARIVGDCVCKHGRPADVSANWARSRDDQTTARDLHSGFRFDRDVAVGRHACSIDCSSGLCGGHCQLDVKGLASRQRTDGVLQVVPVRMLERLRYGISDEHAGGVAVPAIHHLEVEYHRFAQFDLLGSGHIEFQLRCGDQRLGGDFRDKIDRGHAAEGTWHRRYDANRGPLLFTGSNGSHSPHEPFPTQLSSWDRSAQLRASGNLVLDNNVVSGALADILDNNGIDQRLPEHGIGGCDLLDGKLRSLLAAWRVVAHRAVTFECFVPLFIRRIQRCGIVRKRQPIRRRQFLFGIGDAHWLPSFSSRLVRQLRRRQVRAVRRYERIECRRFRVRRLGGDVFRGLCRERQPCGLSRDRFLWLFVFCHTQRNRLFVTRDLLDIQQDGGWPILKDRVGCLQFVCFQSFLSSRLDATFFQVKPGLTDQPVSFCFF